MRNTHTHPDTRAHTALYYLLIMVCQEGAQKLLEHAGDTEGGAAAAGSPETREQPLDEFEVLLRQNSALSLKLAPVQKGITDDALKTHLVLHASRLFQLVREEVRSVLITRQVFGQGPMSMDIGALDAKGKGKGKGNSKNKDKGKGKAEEKPDAEVTCHRKADCWIPQVVQKDATPNKSAEKEVLAVDIGSL